MSDSPQGKSDRGPLSFHPDVEGEALEAMDIEAGLEREWSAVGSSAAKILATTREREEVSAFALLRNAAQTLLSTVSFGNLLQQILDTAVRSLQAERGIIFLGRSLGPDLIPAATSGIRPEELHELGNLSRTLLARVLAGDPVLAADAVLDPTLRDAASVQAQRLRSVLCVPLIVRGELTGAIYVDDRERSHVFTDASVKFLEAFAELAGASLHQARAHDDVVRENDALRQHAIGASPFERFITADPRMLDLIANAELVARVEAPVMISGESGTGKELLARALHHASPRAQRPFLAQNCAAVPVDLMESLFFGYVKGAFTGAVRDTSGLFRLADHGTLFLDEIADLEGSLQAKFLRVLETGTVRPLGSESEQQVDVRVIVASSLPLMDAVQAKRFRDDLYYRVSVVELRIPPLRERRGDIGLLIEHFQHVHQPDPARRARFGSLVLEHLSGLPWRGNVRELESFVRRALIFHAGQDVQVEHARSLLATREPETEKTNAVGLPPQAGDVFPSLVERERAAIEEALRRCAGNRTHAAALLGQHRNALLRRMKRLGITG